MREIVGGASLTRRRYYATTGIVKQTDLDRRCGIQNCQHLSIVGQTAPEQIIFCERHIELLSLSIQSQSIGAQLSRLVG